MKDKTVVKITMLCFCTFIALAYCLTRILSSTAENGKAGILNYNSSLETPPITDNDRIDAYYERPVFPPASELKLEERTLTYLSFDDLDGLDAWLQQLGDTYRDGSEAESDDCQIRYSSLIDRYRADISLLNAVLRGDAGYESVTHFQTPDVLAAAVIYAPISAKFSAFVNQDSIMLPPVNSTHAGETGLEKKELSVKRQLELVGEYNVRMPRACYDEVYEYIFRAHSLSLILHIVHTQENQYLPYSLQISGMEMNEAAGMLAFSLVTAKDIREMQERAKASGRTFDPDSTVVISDGAEKESVGGEVPAFQMPEGFRPLTEPLDFQTRWGV